MTLEILPIGLKAANDFVRLHHRHSCTTAGCKFAIACHTSQGLLVGVAIAGRPVARLLDDGLTLEVLRVCTDGTRNACSILYSRVAKIARLMGYTCVITYTLDSESGASLRAIGARMVAETDPHAWNMPGRRRRHQDIYREPKLRWEL